MYVDFNRIINGLHKFIEREIYHTMADWQETLARLAVNRMLRDPHRLAEKMSGFMDLLGLTDENGAINIDELRNELRELISQKGKIEISVPMFGKYGFRAEDVDRLYAYISEG